MSKLRINGAVAGGGGGEFVESEGAGRVIEQAQLRARGGT